MLKYHHNRTFSSIGVWEVLEIYKKGLRYCSVCERIANRDEIYCSNCHRRTRMKADNSQYNAKNREMMYPTQKRY